MGKSERFVVQMEWLGNRGTGTSDYRSYGRDHEIHADGKAIAIPGSSVPAFRGDGSRYNPEELLIGSISACHMLWFLHLCADAGIVVTAYRDAATGVMGRNTDGSGQFESVTLKPEIELTDESRRAELAALHERAHAMCFIARSVNFPVAVEAA